MNTTDEMNTIDEMRMMSDDELGDVAGGFQVYEGGGGGVASPAGHSKGSTLGNIGRLLFPILFL